MTGLGAALRVGASAGLRAAVASLGLVLLPALVVWLAADGAASAPTTGTGAGWWAPVRAGGLVWLLAHGAHLEVPDTVDVVPLGLTAIAVALVALSSRRAALAVRARSRRPDPVLLAGATAGLVLGYLAVALLVLGVSTTPAAVVPVGPAVLGVLVVAVAGSAPVLLGGRLAALASPLLRSVPARAALERLPPPWRLVGSQAWERGWVGRTPRAALTAAGTVALAGAVVLAWTLVRGGGDVVALSPALRPGAVGGAALVVGQAALLPVGAVWAVAAMAGPGFALGTGTSVTLAGAHLGAVPALPVLAALADLPGSFAPATWALLAVPVLAGALAGRTLMAGPPAVIDLDQRGEAGHPSPRTVVAAALVAVLTSTALLAVLAGVLMAASSGGVGPGRMARVGPPVWSATGALSGEVLLGAALVALPSAWRRARQAPRPTR